MNWRLLTRSGLVFVATFGLLLALALVVLPGSGKGERRGIRIGTVSAKEAEEARRSEPILPDAPNVHEIEGPRFHAYETVEFPGPDGKPETFRYLAFRLSCARAAVVGPRRIHAEDLAFLIFPRPATIEEARLRTRRAAKPVAVIRAGEALAEEVFETGGRDGTPSGRRSRLTLSGGVKIVSTEGGRHAELDADELVCWPDERTVRSDGPVTITADAYRIEGEGLFGRAALGTFTVERDITIELPTEALLGTGAAPADATTTIRCGGPLQVEKLGPAPEKTGRTPTRVTFDGGLHVDQPGAENDPPTTLDARHAELMLLVLTARKPEEDEPTVEVGRLTARGDVRLARGGETKVEAAKLTLLRLPNGERILLEGPADFRHRGALPLAEGSDRPKPPVTVLHVRASESMDIETVAGIYSSARFRGDVLAEHLAADGKTKLRTLRADDLSLSTEEDDGELLIARGRASLLAPGLEGHGEVITYRAESPTVSHVRLDGRTGKPATVLVEGARDFDLLGATTTPAEEEKGGEEGPEPALHLSAEGAITLDTVDEHVAFTMVGPSIVRRMLGKKELGRLDAGGIEAGMVEQELVRLDASGPVHAVGAAEDVGVKQVEAWAEHFAYTASDGNAVLSGTEAEPAHVSIYETESAASEIRSKTLTLFSGGTRMLAAGDVDATVYLREADGEVRPIHLTCAELEVIPEPEGAPTSKDPSGRIQKLTATRDVELDTKEWHARGAELVYESGPPQTIHLRGEPARLTRDQTILGRSFEDRFEAADFTLALLNQKIASFTSPTGGDLVLYRASGDDSFEPLGGGEKKDREGEIERVGAHSGGSMVFDAVKDFAKLEGRAKVTQERGPPGGLSRVMEFEADVLDARFDRREEDNALLFRRAEGRGSVVGRVEGGEIRADALSVDLKFHQTIVTGTPAVVTLDGPPIEVYRAVYNYERHEWTELTRAKPR